MKSVIDQSALPELDKLSSIDGVEPSHSILQIDNQSPATQALERLSDVKRLEIVVFTKRK